MFKLDPSSGEVAEALLSALAAAGRTGPALDAYRRHGAALSLRGAVPGEAVERIAATLDRCRALAPAHPLAFFFDAGRAVALPFSGREAEAAAAAERAAALNPAFSSALRIRLCTLGLLGQDGAAVQARLEALEPGVTVADCLRRAPLTKHDRARYAEGLRRGGLPEG